PAPCASLLDQGGQTKGKQFPAFSVHMEDIEKIVGSLQVLKEMFVRNRDSRVLRRPDNEAAGIHGPRKRNRKRTIGQRKNQDLRARPTISVHDPPQPLLAVRSLYPPH